VASGDFATYRLGEPGNNSRSTAQRRSTGTILPSRPARGPCRRAQRRSRMALRDTASAARSVFDGCEHDGMLKSRRELISSGNHSKIKRQTQARRRPSGRSALFGLGPASPHNGAFQPHLDQMQHAHIRGNPAKLASQGKPRPGRSRPKRVGLQASFRPQRSSDDR